MYRKKYGRLEHSSVISFLVLDRLFPRSIRHCLEKAQRSLQSISETRSDMTATKPERLLGRLAAEYAYATVEEILGQGLHEHLDGLQLKLNHTGAAIHETFFATRPDPGGRDARRGRSVARYRPLRGRVGAGCVARAARPRLDWQGDEEGGSRPPCRAERSPANTWSRTSSVAGPWAPSSAPARSPSRRPWPSR